MNAEKLQGASRRSHLVRRLATAFVFSMDTFYTQNDPEGDGWQPETVLLRKLL